MALAAAKAAPLRPDIKLSQALRDYEAILSPEQRQPYQSSPLEANAVMALTCEINRQNADRKTRRCGTRLTSFLNSVKGFTSIVDLIISGSGNPIAGGVWGAVKVAIQTASGFETYFDSLSKLLMNIGLSSPRHEEYALLYPTSISLQKELCSYYSVVINLCTRVVLFVRKPFIKQITSALRKPFDDEFGTFQKELISLGKAVKEEVSLASKQLQSIDSVEGARERKENSLFRTAAVVFRRETAHELEQARKWREDRAKSRYLNSCSRYNFETTLTQARKKGATTWMFKTSEYQEWISKDSSSTLLCSGIVGAGKTVLCANVVENILLDKSPDSSLGYFFCRSDDAASLKGREVIGSLARQLLQDVPSEEFRSVQVEPSLEEISPDTEHILSNLLLLLPQYKNYIMVLDGLDECEYEEVSIFVESIQSLLKSSKHTFKVFWTGRSDFASRLLEQFRSDFHIHISPSSNGPEISRYIEHALEDALESNRLKLRDPNIVLKIQDALEAGAHEMFLWVAFQIDSICAQNSDHDIINSLKDLPKGLPATFRRILRRLQQSAFTDPSLGRKIFEIVAAAQRPLTLDELGEAISITPGDTAWNKSKLVNDVLKSLESCGSFIVIDEELSTVHFAHSSVKRHLLSKPTDLDVKNYHIDLSQADLNLGKIAVTYLSLDIFSNQLIKSSGVSQPYAANVPSFVVKSALPKRETVNKVALAILRSRKTPRSGSGIDLDRSANLLHEKSTPTQEIFLFLPYCQEYWLCHSNDFYRGQGPVYDLWDSLVNGMVNTVELPWAPEYLADTGELFMEWITNNRHSALTERAFINLWHRYTQKTAMIDVWRMEQLLSLWPNEGSIGSVDVDPGKFTDVLLLQAANGGFRLVVELALDAGADINAQHSIFGNALHEAVVKSRKILAELLINRGADVNLRGGKYGTALVAAAAVPGMDPIVELLISKGADVNYVGGEHGTALIAASAINNITTIKLLLEAKADVNIINLGHSYHTALSAAVWNSNLDAATVLLQSGADLNAYGASALAFAAIYRNEPLVKLLLDHGAVVNKENLDSEKSCMNSYNTTPQIARLLFLHASQARESK